MLFLNIQTSQANSLKTQYSTNIKTGFLLNELIIKKCMGWGWKNKQSYLIIES